MEFAPKIHFHSKDDKPNAPLALKDFLSLRKDDKYFSEKYVISILRQSKFFKNQDLILVKKQDNSEPDAIDNLNKQNKYEIKTFWNQKGCELLSLEKDFGETYKALNFNEDLDYQFNNWNKPDMYNETSKSIIKKMQRKPMNYILFMLNSFCIDNGNFFAYNNSTDVDAKKWQYVIQVNNFDFNIYIIKPTLFNQFVIYKISKNCIENELIFFDDFFEKYITIEGIQILSYY